MKKITQKEWETILKQNPTNEDLIWLIEYTSLKEQAWNQLLKQNPANKDLKYLIEWTSYKKQAQKLLNKRGKKEGKRMIDIIRERDN